mgnify:CR=1 FL=1
MLGGFFQRGGFLGESRWVMSSKMPMPALSVSAPQEKCSEITLDALCCFQNIVPCAHKEHIIATGVDDAYMQAL